MTPEAIPPDTSLDVLSLLPTGVIMWDADLRLVYVNSLAQSMLGYDDTDVLDNAMLEVIVPQPGLKGLLMEVKRAGRQLARFTHRVLLVHITGRTFMGELCVSVLPDKGGCIALLRDISAQYHQQQSLQNRYDFLQAIIDAVPLPVFYRDSNGYTIGCNTAFEQLTGMEREELTFMTLGDLFPALQADRFNALDRRSREERKTVISEITLPEESGGEREYMCYISAYRNENNVIECLLSVLVDMTDRNAAERALMKSYNELRETRDEVIRLERKNTALAMAATANHEINQPLMIAKGNLEMLQSGLDGLADKDQLHLERINNALARIESILKKFKTSTNVHFTDYSESTEMAVLTKEEEEDVQ